MDRFLLWIMRKSALLLPQRLRNRLRLWRDTRAVRRSGLFSESFYLRQNPDMAAEDVDPIVHYLTHGAAEGGNPGDWFDTAHYLEVNADVAQAGMNPLAHYMRHGQREGRVAWSVASSDSDLTQVHQWPPRRRHGVGSYLCTAILHPREGGWMVRKAFSIFRKEGWYGIRRRLQPGAPPHKIRPDVLRGFASFESLPWRLEGSRVQGSPGRIKVLLTSHDASRTGAPLALLGLLTELRKRPDFECWVLLDSGGPLAPEFISLAPTLNLGELMYRCASRQVALETIAALFKSFAARGFAVCNTVATPDINEAFARRGVAVVSWVHELPSSIEAYFGGETTFRAIYDASKLIICPSEFVRDALVRRYRCEAPSKFHVLYYGTAVPERDLRRHQIRLEVRDELGIPQDAVVVLGCGTIDQRKGVDLFVHIASRVLSTQNGSKAWFVWVGNALDGKVLSWCRHDARLLGVADRILFPGERKDIERYFMTADIFALSSREDPFPLVNLEAMAAGLPVVAFRDAGGAQEALRDGRGVLVPYMDLEGFSDAIVKLMHSRETYWAISNQAVAWVHDKAISWTTFVDQFHALLQSDLGLFPARPITVSAIVVCYNHELYLEQRLQSILNQTHPPDEIIFLDDASSDSSVKIAKSIAQRSLVPFKFVLNGQNSGSPFAQWIRGIETAHSDLVWIAEGDDFSDRQFLENLVPAFFDPDVALAYAQSAPVDENGRLHRPDYRDYTADLSATRWDSAYTNDGISEIRDFLAIKNTIPNVSAVVMRRLPASSIPKDLLEFRFAGDWYFYVHLLQAGKISFVPTLLNFHRRHGQTVTSAIERDDQAIIEQLRIKTYILEKFQLPINTITSTIAQTVSEYYRLGELHDLSRVAFTDTPAFQPSICRLRELCKSAFAGPVGGKTLLFVIGDAEMGGGQVAGIRLANELSINHRVFLCNARPEAVDPDFIAMVGSNAVLLEGTLGFVEWAAQSRSAEHQRNRISEGKRRVAVVRELLRFHQIDLIISHIWWADRFIFAVNREMRLAWFIQMHGCYEALAQHPDWDSEFSDLVRPMMALVTGVCYLTPKNLRIFELGKASRPKRLRQFFNGLNPAYIPKSAEGSEVIRSADEFLFCLCSRAIRDKGWEEAITAVLRINSPSPERCSRRRARLLLIGDSEYAKSLKTKYAQHREIEFLGQLQDPLPTIFACDVGLLPSRFVSESVPSTVIEYLACGKPVIATTIGSIPQMIAREGRDAGLLIPCDLPQPAFVDALYDAMLRYMTDHALWEEHRSNASIVFDGQFNLERIAAEYLDFFAEAVREAQPRVPHTMGTAAPERRKTNLPAIRARLDDLGNHSHTSLKFQDDILNFIREHAHRGEAVIEVGCYRGGMTGQLADICAELDKRLYVIDIDEDYLEIAKASVRAVTNNGNVRYYHGDLPGFARDRVCNRPVILVVIDGDHSYRGVVEDITALYSMNPLPYAAAFHDFSLRYAASHLDDIRVDLAIRDSLGPRVQPWQLGEVAGQGATLRTKPGEEDSHYHEQGIPEGVLLICADHVLQRTSGMRNKHTPS